MMEGSRFIWTPASQSSEVDDPLYYRFESLQSHPEGTIRLLTVQPGSSYIVRCTTTVAHLDEEPRYKALSYMWGTEEPNRKISINGRFFRLRSNLWACLKRLQRHKDPTSIWIDAICINQSDILERNQQINVMGKIYSQAEVVIAWTGDDPSGSLRPLERLCELGPLEWPRGPLLEATQALISRPYWDRLWIVQELCLAQEVLVWYGDRGEVQMQWLCDWHNTWYSPLGKDGPPPWQSFHGLHGVWATTRPEYLADMGPCLKELSWLILIFSGMLCLDPRDKVYALLSLAVDQEEHAIMPDYSKSVEDLCRDLDRAYGPSYGWSQYFQKDFHPETAQWQEKKSPTGVPPVIFEEAMKALGQYLVKMEEMVLRI